VQCRGQVLAYARTERTLRGDATDEAAPTTKEEGRFVRDAGSSEVSGFRGARSALSWRVTGGPHGAVARGGLSMRYRDRQIQEYRAALVRRIRACRRSGMTNVQVRAYV